MRPASEVERRRLNDLFAELCAIPSPFGRERAMAERVAADLRALGYEVSEDDAAAETGAECGNLLARIPGRSERSVMLCAHLDTVPHEGVVEPVLVDGGWESAGDTILGADNKAAVAMLLALAHRAAVEGSPVGVELIFSVSEENGLNGARVFDVSQLRSRHRLRLRPRDADRRGRGRVADLLPPARGLPRRRGPRRHPPRGRAQRDRRRRQGHRRHAARAHRRRDDGQRRDDRRRRRRDERRRRALLVRRRGALAERRGGRDRRGRDGRPLQRRRQRPACECDVDVTVERVFTAYRHRTTAPGVVAAEAALRACNYTPRRILSGGGSDANAFEANGLHCINLANGTERNHESAERVSQIALEGMLDVTFALLDELAEG